MTTKKKASAASCRRVIASLEQQATLFQFHHEVLGVPKAAAMDFAFRADALSDLLTKRAAEAEAEEKKGGEEKPEEKPEEAKKEAAKVKAANSTKTPTAGHFPPQTIGQKVSGPLRQDADEAYMKGHFTQEIFAALSDKQMSGALASAAAAHRADPKMAAARIRAATAAAMAVLTAGEEPEEEKPEEKTAGEAPEEKAEDEKPTKEAGEDDEPKADDEESDADKVAALFGL